MTDRYENGLVSSRRGGTSPGPHEQRNIDVVTAFLEAKPLSDRSRFLAPDAVSNRVGMQQLCELAGIPDAGPGPHAGYHQDSFSDRRNEIVDIIASGDTVWAMFRMVGTHTGDFWGVPGTGRPLDLLELGVFRLEDGRIAESWWLNDELAICIQLGIPVGMKDLSGSGTS